MSDEYEYSRRMPVIAASRPMQVGLPPHYRDHGNLSPENLAASQLLPALSGYYAPHSVTTAAAAAESRVYYGRHEGTALRDLIEVARNAIDDNGGGTYANEQVHRYGNTAAARQQGVDDDTLQGIRPAPSSISLVRGVRSRTSR
jgi:hypothetical protein